MSLLILLHQNRKHTAMSDRENRKLCGAVLAVRVGGWIWHKSRCARGCAKKIVFIHGEMTKLNGRLVACA